MGQQRMEAPLLGIQKKNKTNLQRTILSLVFVFLTFSVVGLVLKDKSSYRLHETNQKHGNQSPIVESEQGVVAADDSRCSDIGVSMLRQGGHAVDAAVATALCVGVVNPVGSGIGGGAFMVFRSSSNAKTQAFDMRETAPLAATQDMYDKDPNAKYVGALSMGVPGEIAGLHRAWSEHGRLPWKTLFQPAIKLAREGFVLAPYLELALKKHAALIMDDPGLSKEFSRNGKLLKPGDVCYNKELAQSLQVIADEGPGGFYNGSVGEKLVKDVKEAGGILTMDDLRSYRVEVSEAMSVNVMGYTVLGMPPPSSGTVGLSLVLNVLKEYGSSHAANPNLGLHRLIEAMKHMLAARMDLGDPAFVNITADMHKLLSESYAKIIRNKIFDNTTFPPEYYLNRWSQLKDHGTSHFCIVDADRNTVSMTTTVNYAFGAGVISPSTGILLNNEMGDFSTPTDINSDMLPPAPSNFIKPNKRPLSSMTPLIVTKDDELIGVIGGSGGIYIIPAVIQVFFKHFILGMEPLAAVQSPRVYHTLIPNVVLYENWTVIDGEHIELAKERKHFLKSRGHELEGMPSGAAVQLIVQSFEKPTDRARKNSKDPHFYGRLTAVSDPRKDGKPAAV